MPSAQPPPRTSPGRGFWGVEVALFKSAVVLSTITITLAIAIAPFALLGVAGHLIAKRVTQ